MDTILQNTDIGVSKSNKDKHAESWKNLARNIAKLKDVVGSNTDLRCKKKGQLTIIGSGIESMGFSLGDEKLIKEADKVFYCVADPVTVAWLNKVRPDALDLYVLYDDHKVRYVTYMQMTEAQLYYVRKGMTVVVIFYGHPGIFVLSTHRAIAIAKREGHEAIMKAGVSALDCLCADLGVDPAHPGMQTHEATDMILRQRKPDTSLHVVLWQVGLIGEMGFRRQGYINSNFSVFIDYLQGFYGKDYVITHYIASRYPTLKPVIEKYKLSNLHRPEIQTKITGLSTFYLAPKDAVNADEEIARKLGLITGDQKLKKVNNPLRVVDLYGSREKKAFTDFAKFTVPKGYHYQEQTNVARFLLELKHEPRLQMQYRDNPQELLSLDKFNYLDAKDKSMICSRDSGALQIAAKGLHKKSVINQKFLLKILRQRSEATKLLALLNTTKMSRSKKSEVITLLTNAGYEFEWDSLAVDINLINRDFLLSWTGVYLDAQQKCLITIIGSTLNATQSLVFVNDYKINHICFTKGKLSWQQQHANINNGFLRLDIQPKTGKRSLIGKIWNRQNDQLVSNFKAEEVIPPRRYVNRLTNIKMINNDPKLLFGTYYFRSNNEASINIFEVSSSDIIINGTKIIGVERLGNKFKWQTQDNSCDITFFIDPFTMRVNFFGTIAVDGNNLACVGAKICSIDINNAQGLETDTLIWVWNYLKDISLRYTEKGGLLLWPKWEKHNLSNTVINGMLANLN